jgi:hypothetical protein
LHPAIENGAGRIQKKNRTQKTAANNLAVEKIPSFPTFLEEREIGR